MRKMLMTVGVMLALFAIGVPAAEAQRRGGPGGPGPRVAGPGGPGGGPAGFRRGGPGARLRALRQLDLTAEQKAQVKDLATKARDEAKPLMQALREQRQAMRAAIAGGTARDAARRDFRASTESLRQQLKDIRQKTRSAVRGAVGK